MGTDTKYHCANANRDFTQQVFDAMRPVFQKAVDVCKELLKRNNLKGSQLNKLILVGGTTYSPLIRQLCRYDSETTPFLQKKDKNVLFCPQLLVTLHPRRTNRRQMKRMIIATVLLSTMLSLSAQNGTTTAREDIAENPWLAGSNYVDYDRQLPDFQYTKAPKGYVPFYFSHYGRHGARWLIGSDDYERVLRPLRKARQQGKLTREGQEALRQIETFNKTTHQRLGDLTTVGERQHHGIGRRMTEHFPEIFVKTRGVQIDARSTTVNRCILSMVAECEELMAANPTARIHNDVSDALQYYLNQPWSDRLRQTAKKGDRVRHDFSEAHTHPERLMEVLFSDQQWVRDSVRAGSLMRHLFEVVINMQSHDDGPDLLSLFTNDELYELWRIQNVSWYQHYGPSPVTDGIMPFSQQNLLTNIIETADTCLRLSKPQATLRFGHEVCVMPLACLMELGTCGAQVTDMEQLDQQWRNYRIFPMGCNIQLIFYRPKKSLRSNSPSLTSDDILVKALLNEREVTLPVAPTATPYYYKWSDLRQYWMQKLTAFSR